MWTYVETCEYLKMPGHAQKYVTIGAIVQILGNSAVDGSQVMSTGATLADLLHTVGRLITHHWPTYYMLLGHAKRHILAALRGRRAPLAIDAYPSHVWN